jgi:hypothetical protein
MANAFDSCAAPTASLTEKLSIPSAVNRGAMSPLAALRASVRDERLAFRRGAAVRGLRRVDVGFMGSMAAWLAGKDWL